jgi:hypothetical protein
MECNKASNSFKLEIYHLKILIKKKKKLKASKEIMLLIKLEIYLPLFIQNLQGKFKKTIKINRKIIQIKKRVNHHLRRQVII